MSNSIPKLSAEKLNSAKKPGYKPAEQELAPGIYFTPAPKQGDIASNSHGIPEPPEVQNMTREELESEYRSTSKSIRKLGESNDIMKQCDPNGEDPVLVQAIRENTDIIVRRKLRMVLVKARLDYFIRSQPHNRPSRFAAQSGASAAATMASSISAASSTSTVIPTTVDSATTAASLTSANSSIAVAVSDTMSQTNNQPVHDPAVHGFDL